MVGKILLFCCLILCIHSKLVAQDTIVTVEQDTISCKITRVSNEFVHFTVFDKTGIVLMRSRLPLSKIQQYEQTESQRDPIVSNESVAKEEKELLSYEEERPSKIRVGLNTGYTYQFGGYEGLPATYKNQLQSLWNFAGEANYFVSKHIGLGARYSYIFTKANEDLDPRIFGFSQLRDEKVNFTYLALSLMYRKFFYEDQIINYFVSGGIINYRTDGLGDGVPFYQEGDTFGFAFGFSYDLLLTEHIGMGIGAEANIATLRSFIHNGVSVPADFKLNRLDITLGLRLFK